jgi:hypothetical protein
MKPMILTMCLLVVTYVGGCATITGGTTRSVHIGSKPDGAEVTVTNSAGETVFTGKTPAVAVLKPGKGYFRGEDYTVTFKMAGYACSPVKIKRGLNGWYLAGNFFFGGLIGYLVVDPLTGAMWTLDEKVTAELSPLSSSRDNGGALKIVCVDDLPTQFKGHLVRMK